MSDSMSMSLSNVGGPYSSTASEGEEEGRNRGSFSLVFSCREGVGVRGGEVALDPFTDGGSDDEGATEGPVGLESAPGGTTVSTGPTTSDEESGSLA